MKDNIVDLDKSVEVFEELKKRYREKRIQGFLIILKNDEGNSEFVSTNLSLLDQLGLLELAKNTVFQLAEEAYYE